MPRMTLHAKTTRFWVPDLRANVCQIGEWVTRRKENESLPQLLERAIRRYPRKDRDLVVIGWR